MTRTQTILLAALGSALLLAGAYVFQALGYAPCQLCLLQRWPHAAALAIGVAAVFVGWRWLALAGAAAALTTAGLGLYHTGVERGWWEGPTTCASGSIAGISVDDLLNPAANVAPLIRCDAVAWQMLGLSMASWNALFSLGLAAIWLLAWRSRR